MYDYRVVGSEMSYGDLVVVLERNLKHLTNLSDPDLQETTLAKVQECWMFCCMCCMCVACVSMFSLRRNTNVHKVIKILRGIIIIMCMQDFLVKFDLSLSQTEKVRC